MDYKVFVEKIVSLLQERMGAVYEVKVTNVVKNNSIQLTGVIMMREADRISPTIYLEEPYREYCSGTDIQEIVDKIVLLYEMQIREIDFDINFFENFDCVKDRIFHKMIHYEKNKKLLEDLPHLRWCDLAVVFYYGMEDKKLGRASILIHNNHVQMWGQSTDILFQTAQYNMKQRMPELLIPMQKLIEEMIGMKAEETDEVKLYVLTNMEKVYGASALLYSEKMRELADWLESDLLILPSSVHEVLLMPDDKERKYDSYSKMVEEVNTTQVEPEEILSYSLYRYNREKAVIEEINV